MNFLYKLGIELVKCDMNKTDFVNEAAMSWASVTKMTKNENVSMEVLKKVCKALGCDIGDIRDIISNEFE
jgi:DNA-binding Xre family transcriptional regulator